ncbi:ABC transporter substrate-binding protein [Massilia sp. HP4]|uniref:substrate-binding periplasmic protein n=1 Tax=Massilia sp. HP4 TaxID=2562316 RepID=UPI0010BFAC40|nr:ABC transporter substrate-binding protein [Massilia sp. HP4]
MSIWQACVAAVILAACPGAARSAPQPRLYLTTETSAPSSMLVNGRVVGIATDKLRSALARTGVAYEIALLPWKRAYTAALQRPDTCVYSTTRTPEREALFKWIGPLDAAQWVLMGRADRKLALTSLEQARGLRIGTYHGDARDAYLRGRGFVTDAAPNDFLNAQKLLQGRIDLWAASWRRGSTVLQQHGWDKHIVPVLAFHQIEVYLACNRSVPDTLVARLNAELGAMARDGTAQRIERAYD